MHKNQLVVVFKQRGAVLITVLFVLVLVTIIGALGIRQSVTQLNLTTTSQINALLDGMSDTALTRVLALAEQSIGDRTGMMARILDSENNANSELLFCYRPQKNTYAYTPNTAGLYEPKSAAFNSAESDVRKGVGGATREGACSLTDRTSAFGPRDLGVVQIAITRTISPVNPNPTNLTEADPAWKNLGWNDGSDLGFGGSGSGGGGGTSPLNKPVTVFVTAILSNAVVGYDVSKAQTCLDERLLNDMAIANIPRQSLDECLAINAVPYVTKVRDFRVLGSDEPTIKGPDGVIRVIN